MSNSLEDEFHDAMVNIYKRALEAGYKATYFLQMVNKSGGVATAKQLINSEKVSVGFTKLWELGKLDLTVEALVQDPKWKSLFTAEEIEKARKRLDEYKKKMP